MELFRHKNGDVSIRLNLINGPVKYKRERTITIALQASPVKPMPKGWRGWSDGFDYKGNKHSAVLASCPYWGGYTAWAMRYPAFQDFGYIRKLVETMKTGRIDEAYKKQSSTYQRGKKLLIVCGSYTGDITAQLTCSGTVKSARNLETGAALSVSGKKISFPLKKHDFIIIEAELK